MRNSVQSLHLHLKFFIQYSSLFLLPIHVSSYQQSPLFLTLSYLFLLFLIIKITANTTTIRTKAISRNILAILFPHFGLIIFYSLRNCLYHSSQSLYLRRYNNLSSLSVCSLSKCFQTLNL